MKNMDNYQKFVSKLLDLLQSKKDGVVSEDEVKILNKLIGVLEDEIK